MIPIDVHYQNTLNILGEKDYPRAIRYVSGINDVAQEYLIVFCIVANIHFWRSTHTHTGATSTWISTFAYFHEHADRPL
jgi:hypothetical protein